MLFLALKKWLFSILIHPKNTQCTYCKKYRSNSVNDRFKEKWLLGHVHHKELADVFWRRKIPHLLFYFCHGMRLPTVDINISICDFLAQTKILWAERCKARTVNLIYRKIENGVLNNVYIWDVISIALLCLAIILR